MGRVFIRWVIFAHVGTFFRAGHGSLSALLEAVVRPLFQQPHDLDGGDCGERQKTVAFDLVGAAQADQAAGEVVLEAGVDALGGAALLVAEIFGRTPVGMRAPLGLGELFGLTDGVSMAEQKGTTSAV